MIPKYRLVDKVKKVIWNVESISWDFGAEVDFLHVDAFNDVGDTKTFSRQFELLQSTGLKDKNDVEIFEGDIVSCFREGLSIVEYQYGSFGLVCNEYFESFINVLGSVEVVGNKFENRELLDCDSE